MSPPTASRPSRRRPRGSGPSAACGICTGRAAPSDEGEGLPLADTLPELAALHAAETAEPDVAFGLRRDVGRLLAALPPACRQVAVALSEMSATEAARALGLNRCTIYARLASIRAAALALGLEDYRPRPPTLRGARR